MKSEKTVFRIKKTSNYVSISRFTLEDNRLTWEARGLHAFLLAKPDDWKTCIAHLIKCSPAGRDKTRRIVKELIKYNYIVKSEQRNKQGKFSSPQYIVYETPCDEFLEESINSNISSTDKPSSVKPLSVIPSPINPSLLSKQTEVKKQDNNKTTTTRINLIWSPKLTNKHKESIETLLEEVDEEIAQLLLDELSGQMEFIKNPIGYFRTLLQAHACGDFIPAKALQIQASRIAAHKNDMAVERSLKLAEEQLQLRMNKLLKKDNDSHE